MGADDEKLKPDILDEEPPAPPAMNAKEALARQLMKVICICKGINLGRVLKGLEGSETVAEVNAKTGCGSGGCQGERCGPRIKILLRKKEEAQKK